MTGTVRPSDKLTDFSAPVVRTVRGNSGVAMYILDVMVREPVKSPPRH